MPVSRDATIEVKILDKSTPTTEAPDASKPGVRGYKLTLDPGQEKVGGACVYEVRHPQGAPLMETPVGVCGRRSRLPEKLGRETGAHRGLPAESRLRDVDDARLRFCAVKTAEPRSDRPP